MAGKNAKPASPLDPSIEDPKALAALIAEPLGDDDYSATIAFLGGDDEALERDGADPTPEATSSDPPGTAAKVDTTDAGGGDAGAAGADKKDDTAPAGSEEGAVAGDAGTADALADPGGGSDASEAGQAPAIPENYARDTLFELAKAENARLHNENRTLRAQGATPPAATTDTQPAGVDLTGLKTKVEKIKGDYGEDIGDVLDGLFGVVETVTADNADLRSKLDQGSEDSERQAVSELDRDIREIPELAVWQADAIAFQSGDLEKDPSRFADAEAFDNQLVLRPEWGNKPRTERFAQAVRMVKLMRGEAASTGSPQASTESGEKPAQPTAVNVDQIVQDATRRRVVPETAGDITGGSPSDDSGENPLDKLDDGDLEDYLMNANSDQRAAFIAAL